MQKKSTLIIVALVIVGGIIGLLFMNKQKIEETKKKQVILTDYPVQTTKASVKQLDEVLALSGNVVANSEVNFVSETQGRVIAVNFDIGSKVGAGTVLAKVDDELKKATLMQAEASYEKAKKDYDRIKTLFEQKSMNEATLDQAKFGLQNAEAQLIMAKKAFRDTKVTSPISGVVTVKNIEKGSFLNIGTPIATIIDINTIKIRVYLSEMNIRKVTIGEKIRLKSELFPNRDFTGTIKFINPKADESHTYATDIVISNPKGDIKPGMFFTAYFDRIISGNALVIPRNALVGSAKKPQVYVVKDGKAYIRDIKIYRIVRDEISVQSGINEGEEIVYSGQINLKNGINVKVLK